MLRMLESLLEDLDELPLSEAGDVAVELGLVAMRLESLSRRERRQVRLGGPSDRTRPVRIRDDDDDDE